MSTRSIIGVAIILPLAIIIFFVLNASSPSTGVRMGSKPAEAACTRPAPDCLPSDLTLVDSNREAHPPEALKGKVIVLNFWATWCKPCKKEIPAFNRVFERYKEKGVEMFGVITEDIDPSSLLNFASDHEMTYPIVYLDSTVARHFGMPSNIPTTFIYDKHGSRAVNHTGALDEGELAAKLDQLLAE
jgi:thiol-disulfide isomerase/thioredoxin